MKKNKIKKITQITAGFRYGDAISNHILFIHEFLKKNGYECYIKPLQTNVCSKYIKIFKEQTFSKNEAIIYHHSIGLGIDKYLREESCPKLFIYHNLTPEKYFLEYSQDLCNQLKNGRNELSLYKDIFKYSLNDSQYNSNELLEKGFSHAEVLPIIFQKDLWDIEPEPKLLGKLSDGRKNIIFVGRIAPNKKQEDLLFLINELKNIEKSIRLVLVGYGDWISYNSKIDYIIQKLNLKDYVLNLGAISQNELKSVYKTAHLFCSMSEHEGFCVPIIESMWNDVPIMAYKSSAVPETMGESGIIFNSKEDFKSLAALAYLLIHDQALRDKVLTSQRKRREYYLIENQIHNYNKIIEYLEMQYK